MAEEVSNTSYTSLFDKILDTGLGIADSYFTSRSERAVAQNQKTLLEAQICNGIYERYRARGNRYNCRWSKCRWCLVPCYLWQFFSGYEWRW